MQSDLPDSIHSGDEELVWRVKSDFMYFTQVTQVTFIRGTRPVASWQQFGLWDSLHLPMQVCPDVYHRLPLRFKAPYKLLLALHQE